MALIKGKLFMLGTDAGANQSGEEQQTVAYATSHTLDISCNLDDVLTKDDNEDYKRQEVSSISWSIKTENLIAADPDDEGSPTYAAIVAAMREKKKVNIVLHYLPTAAGYERKGEDWTASGSLFNAEIPGNDYVIVSGVGYITSIELNAENKSNVSYTATFTGYGTLTAASDLSV